MEFKYAVILSSFNELHLILISPDLNDGSTLLKLLPPSLVFSATFSVSSVVLAPALAIAFR